MRHKRRAAREITGRTANLKKKGLWNRGKRGYKNTTADLYPYPTKEREKWWFV